jgi:glucosamine--fructose-6-phosphate aminotransferase (isomerizing)
VASGFAQTRLWREARGIPRALERTLAEARGFDEVAALIAAKDARRVIVAGNGAALYVAHALWLASLGGESGFELVAVPAGVLASGRFAWREGDRLVVVSSSGELRDAVEALEGGAPRPYAAVTANERSRIAAGAGAAALVHVEEQETETHTQAYCGNLAAAFAIWARVTGDAALSESLAAAPTALARLIDEAEAWAARAADGIGAPSAAVAFGSGPAWPAALEAALLLKEVAGVPAEGLETREGATSGMYALAPGHLALSLSTGEDGALAEAEQTCRRTGATVLRLPGGEALDARLAGLATFPAALALAAELGVRAGLDVDHPAWADAYYNTTRVTE